MRPPTQSEGKEFVIPTEGSHIVILFRIIDLGTQDTEYKGEAKKQHRIQFGFEVTDQLHDFGTGEKPLYISKTYTYSFYKSSHLLADLVSWRGEFRPEQIDMKCPECFDIESMLGKPAYASITHKTYEDGTKRAFIKGLIPIPDTLQVPLLTRTIQSLILEKDRFDENLFNSLSEYTQNKIAKSPEYQACIRTEEDTFAGGDPLADSSPDSEISTEKVDNSESEQEHTDIISRSDLITFGQYSAGGKVAGKDGYKWEDLPDEYIIELLNDSSPGYAVDKHAILEAGSRASITKDESGKYVIMK